MAEPELLVQAALALGFATVVGLAMRGLRPQGFTVLEPGLLLGIFALFYTVIPLLAFGTVTGAMQSAFSDARLRLIAPDSDALTAVGWLHVCFVVVFLGAYLVVRSASPALRAGDFRASDSDLLLLLLLYGGATAFVRLSMRLAGVGGGADDYAASYLLVAELPLLLQQILAHVGGIATTCSIALALALMTRPRLRWLVLAWIALEFVLAVGALGSRTTLFAILLTALFAYQLFVRPLTAPLMLSSLLLGIVGFLVLGALRNAGGDIGAGDWGARILLNNEFTSVFVNALDIHAMGQETRLPKLGVALYVADLFNVIPQQFLPFEKMDLSRWYVQTFYPDYAATGGGLVFGIVPESLLGNGLVDVLLRAAVLGMLMGAVHLYVASGRVTLWRLTAYVWLLVFSYRLFRTTTLYLLPAFVLDFMPAMIGFFALRLVLGLRQQMKRGVNGLGALRVVKRTG